MAAVTMGGDRLRGHCGGSAGLRHRRAARGLYYCVLFPHLRLLPQLAPLPQVRVCVCFVSLLGPCCNDVKNINVT